MKRLEARFRVHVASGLHARVAMRFAETAAAFTSAVEVHRGATVGDGKNALAVLMLVAGPDDEILVRVRGKDAQEALVALAAFIEREVGAPVGGHEPAGSERRAGAAAR